MRSASPRSWGQQHQGPLGVRHHLLVSPWLHFPQKALAAPGSTSGAPNSPSPQHPTPFQLPEGIGSEWSPRTSPSPVPARGVPGGAGLSAGVLGGGGKEERKIKNM